MQALDSDWVGRRVYSSPLTAIGVVVATCSVALPRTSLFIARKPGVGATLGALTAKRRPIGATAPPPFCVPEASPANRNAATCTMG
eukprot:1189570-Prorocentrum_minimum.AAC.2